MLSGCNANEGEILRASVADQLAVQLPFMLQKFHGKSLQREMPGILPLLFRVRIGCKLHRLAPFRSRSQTSPNVDPRNTSRTVNETCIHQCRTQVMLLKRRAASHRSATDRGQKCRATTYRRRAGSIGILHHALLGEDVAINLDVNSLSAVHHLRDPEIGGDAHK